MRALPFTFLLPFPFLSSVLITDAHSSLLARNLENVRVGKSSQHNGLRRRARGRRTVDLVLSAYLRRDDKVDDHEQKFLARYPSCATSTAARRAEREEGRSSSGCGGGDVVDQGGVEVREQLAVVHAVISHQCQPAEIRTMATLRTSHQHTLAHASIPSRRCCSAQIS